MWSISLIVNTIANVKVEAIKNANIGTTAEKISVLPDDIMEEIILDKVRDNRIAIGLDSEKVAPYYIDNRSQVKLILGPSSQERLMLFKVILEQLTMRKSFYLIQGQEIWMTMRIIMWYMLIQQVILENLLQFLKISSRRERGHIANMMETSDERILHH